MRAMWADLSLKKKGLAVLLAPVVPLLGALAFLYVGYARDAATDAAINAARLRQLTVDEILHEALNAETGMRGYLLTEDAMFLEPFENARNELPIQLARLDGGPQGADENLVEEIRRRAGSVMDVLIAVRAAEESSASEARQNRLLERSKSEMDGLRVTVGQLDERIEVSIERLRQRREANRTSERYVLLFGGIAGIVGGVIGMLVLATGILRQVRSAVDGARNLPHGKPLGDLAAGRDEIGELSVALRETKSVLDAQEAAKRASETAILAARDEAERANRAKSEFLSRMSHELRTPLNAILGFGQLLEMDGLSKDQKESVRQILKGGRHLLSLIDEVLDIARIEAGQMRVSLEDVDVSEVVVEAVDLVRPMAAERGILIAIDSAGPADPSTYVHADRQRLKQVVLNLVSNAVKYNREGGTISIAFRAEDEEVAIAVADTGSGISPSDLERVFVPFDRLGAEAGSIPGTGLGLALSNKLVEAMNGSIDVRSVRGEGSVFTVRLPCGHGVRAVSGAGAPVPAGASWLRDARILYVEDNLSNLKLVEMILRQLADVRVESAMTGRSALDLAARHHFDAIILDLHLPDMGGDDVLIRLRGLSRAASTPVIVLSADATRSTKEKLLALGATAYITKPIDVPTFLRTLENAVAAAEVVDA